MTDQGHAKQIDALRQQFNQAMDSARSDGLIVKPKLARYARINNCRYLNGQDFVDDVVILRKIDI